MPYAVQYDVPGDEHLYARVKTAIGEEVPEGLRVHLVVASPTGGLRHIEVWDDEAQYRRFDQDRVAPAVREVLSSMGVPGPVPPPDLDVLDLVDVQVPA